MSEPVPSTEAVTVLIADLVRDGRLQVRSRMDQRTVNSYARAMTMDREFPPVTVAHVGGALYLVDGWHRVAAVEVNKGETVEARVEVMTWAEAQRVAFTANLEHGLPLRPAEKREVFRKYMKAGLWRNHQGRPKSSREIASDLAGMMTHTTVLNRIRADFPKLAKHWNGEEVSGWKGGLREVDLPDPTEDAKVRLREALAVSRGITCPGQRGELLEELERVRQEIEAARPWVAPMF